MLIPADGRFTTLSGRPTVSKADTLLRRNRHSGCEWEAPNDNVKGRATTSGAMSKPFLGASCAWRIRSVTQFTRCVQSCSHQQ